VAGTRRISAFTDAYVKRCTASQWKGTKGRCRWCNDPIGLRRRRWCSDKCNDLYRDNHWWHNAKKRARRRDKYRCVKCGATKKDGTRLEVNHIVPILGRHDESGCHHHIDGLETVCRPCHLIITKEQFRKDK
jgi:hypothetical protein